jgi:hypothetical protein
MNNSISNTSKTNRDVLNALLFEIKLQDYIEPFEVYGVDSIADICILDETDCNVLQLSLEDWKRLVEHVKKEEIK